jgi:hypothetical protein
MVGGAMQPHLDDADARPAGPQMLVAWSAERDPGPADPAVNFANYQGNMPDYVMGTDWKKAMTSPPQRIAVSSSSGEDALTDDVAAEPAVALTRTAFDEPAAPAHAYPSMVGDHPSVIEVPAGEAETPDGAG